MRLNDGVFVLEQDGGVRLLDFSRGRLIALRDPFGGWPLFWRADRGVLRVGTRLRPLAAQTPAARINLDFLTSFLMYAFAFAELHSEATAFSGVQRILPGTVVALSPDGRRELLSSWDWLEKAGDPVNTDIQEAAARLGELLSRAVGQRIERGKVAAHLSGGLDSSSVVCLARSQLATGPGARRLAALSLLYSAESLSGEQRFIKMVADQGGPLDWHSINGDLAVAFDWFRAPIPDHDEPCAGLFHLPLETALVERARQLGATRILTGAGADDILGGNRCHIADMLRRGQVQKAIGEASKWARWENTSLWSILYEYGIAPNLPGRLHDGVAALLRGGYGRFPDLGHFSIPPWVRHGFARKHSAWSRGLEVNRRLYRFPFEKSVARFSLTTSAGYWASWNLAGPLGIQISHPFLDPRLILHCLRVPREVKDKPGPSEPMLREAMRGVLPEEIRTRRLKRGFTEVYFRGLAQNLPRLEEMVVKSRIDDLEMFDKQILLQALRQHAAGIGEVMAGGRINSSLAIMAWYEQVQSPAAPETATATHRLERRLPRV